MALIERHEASKLKDPFTLCDRLLLVQHGHLPQTEEADFVRKLERTMVLSPHPERSLKALHQEVESGKTPVFYANHLSEVDIAGIAKYTRLFKERNPRFPGFLPVHPDWDEPDMVSSALAPYWEQQDYGIFTSSSYTKNELQACARQGFGFISFPEESVQGGYCGGSTQLVPSDGAFGQLLDALDLSNTTFVPVTISGTNCILHPEGNSNASVERYLMGNSEQIGFIPSTFKFGEPSTPHITFDSKKEAYISNLMYRVTRSLPFEQQGPYWFSSWAG